MQEETPEFFEERDLLGQVKPKLHVPEGMQQPEIKSTEPTLADEYEDPDNGTRFLGYLIDFACSMALVFIVAFVLGAMRMGYLLDKPADTLVTYFLMIVYYCIFESVTGRTIGKFATGTKVIDSTGETPTLSRVIGRTFCRFIPFDALSFFGGGPGGWHDTISKTRVVKVK